MIRHSLLRRTLLALAALLAWTMPLAAAAPVTFDATGLGSPLMLDKNWRVGISPDPAAAMPGFDDSGWVVRNASESIADVPDYEAEDKDSGKASSRQEFAWFRLHIKLAPHHGPIALLVEIPVARLVALTADSEDAVVYANGRAIRPEVRTTGPPERYFAITRLYDLDVDPETTDLTLVIRTLHIPFGLQSYTRFFASRTLYLGSPDDLRRFVELWNNHTFFERLPNIENSIELAALSFFLLALYFTQKGHREYLWLALYELVLAPISFIDLAARSAYLESLLYEALNCELGLAAAYLYFEFLVDILDLRRSWAGKRKRWILFLLRWTTPILACVGPALFFASHSVVLAVILAAVSVIGAFWLAGWLLFCFIVLINATIRRNFEAGLLLIPLVLSVIGVLEPLLGYGISSVTGHPYRSPLTFTAGPVPIYFSTVANYVGLLAIVLIIFMRFQRIHRDRERAASELAAARSVQELMIPQEKIDTPGFEVDSVYTPANEVGGDFFHVETTQDGGLLVVIGDVAGKGLQAAMNVSMLIGALRRGEEMRPAKILETLNRVLVGGGSFTTCQVAWFGLKGELVIASAGHLPPYLNSQEIALPGGLPLGVVSSVTYDETRLYLHPGDRVLFLSDGVVEARRADGELFGFDRVHNLSNQSAFYITDAAKSFGQEDDITVLTVRRLAPAGA